MHDAMRAAPYLVAPVALALAALPLVPATPLPDGPRVCATAPLLSERDRTAALEPLEVPVVITAQTRFATAPDPPLIPGDSYYLAAGTYPPEADLDIVSIATETIYSVDAASLYCDPNPLRSAEWDTPIRFLSREGDGGLRLDGLYDVRDGQALTGPVANPGAFPPPLTWRPLSEGATWATPWALRRAPCTEGSCTGTLSDYHLVAARSADRVTLLDPDTLAISETPLAEVDPAHVDAFLPADAVYEALGRLTRRIDAGPSPLDRTFCPGGISNAASLHDILTRILHSDGSGGSATLPRQSCLSRPLAERLGALGMTDVSWTGAEQVTASRDHLDHIVAVPALLADLPALR